MCWKESLYAMADALADDNLQTTLGSLYYDKAQLPENKYHKPCIPPLTFTLYSS
ncbi:hypothetical protein GGGNBK_04730 [Sporosarcina sp. ANT_H38]